jgi:hypothetical protein
MYEPVVVLMWFLTVLSRSVSLAAASLNAQPYCGSIRSRQSSLARTLHAARLGKNRGEEMHQRIAACAVMFALAVVSLVPVSSASAQSKKANDRLIVPVSGTVNSATGSLTGNFAITQFANQNGQLVATGMLTATVLNSAGQIVQTIVQQVTLPVTALNAACEILHLELGPLDLTLLGLAVHLDRIVLDITAVPGPGNLLGNLLCQIAGLLDGGTLGNALSNLLNRLLGVLAGL